MLIKWIIQIIFVTGILGSMTHTSAAEDSIHIPDVVATVNGNNITGQQLVERMAQSRAMDPERFDAMDLEQRKKAVIRTIDSMIVREVIYQEAVKRDIVVTDEEINLNLDGLKKQFPSEEAFHKTLADARITIHIWKEETRKNLMAVKLEDLMVNELQITEKEIKWQRLRPAWLKGLLTNAKVWKWSP